jgi:aldose 1-epimerase
MIVLSFCMHVRRFTLRNANGVSVQILDYGAIITTIMVPDKCGKFDDVTSGFDSLAGLAYYS